MPRPRYNPGPETREWWHPKTRPSRTTDPTLLQNTRDDQPRTFSHFPRISQPWHLLPRTSKGTNCAGTSIPRARRFFQGIETVIVRRGTTVMVSIA
ncbi:hypothetical protein TIFTF001_056205 [Ficus carica]|uniref:Uncharacterized protein n=1 Tax=Ficus carica TaxID=3494 RepID=A0AA88EHX0_FICCA|nr:hypothetical protein TIFTF001_056205 [Ficus carica]